MRRTMCTLVSGPSPLTSCDPQDYNKHASTNETTVKEILGLAQQYNKSLEEEEKMTPEQLAIKNVGKVDPKRHLEDKVDLLMTTNIVQCLGAMLDTVIFK